MQSHPHLRRPEGASLVLLTSLPWLTGCVYTWPSSLEAALTAASQRALRYEVQIKDLEVGTGWT